MSHPLTPARRGEALSADRVNAMISAARQTYDIAGSADIETFGAPGVGVSIANAPKDEESLYYLARGCVRCKHTTDEVAPFCGVVELYDTLNSTLGGGQIDRPGAAFPYAETVLLARKPTVSGLSRIGILMQGLGHNKAGWVQIVGISSVLYNPLTITEGGLIPGINDDYGSDDNYPRIGARLGCRKNSYYAQWDELGPLRVVGSLKAKTTSADYHVAVQVTRERGDYVFVEDEDTTDTANNRYFNTGPFRTIACGPGLTVTETSKGAITIDVA